MRTGKHYNDRLREAAAQDAGWLLTMLLKNLRLATLAADKADAQPEDRPADLRVRQGRIAEIGRGLRPRRWEKMLDLAGHLALPGLINGHDQLADNLLPHLGTPPYGNHYAFAAAVNQPDAAPTATLMRTAVKDRLWWGGYKNVIAGVTTVAHHDLFRRRNFHRGFPVKVVRRYGWAHSLGYCDDPVAAFRRAIDQPFIIRAAEGVDEVAGIEIDELDALGMLAPNTVLVHGIAVDRRQLACLADAAVSLVWCPASNLRLYGATAPIAALKGPVRLALGTDATLSGSPTLLHEARAAAATGLATAEEIFAMVTRDAATIFQLRDGRGTLTCGAPADVVILPDHGDAPAQALLATQPEDIVLVLLSGVPRRATPDLAAKLELGPPNARIGGTATWLHGDLAALRARIAAAAGDAALDGHPLWTLLEGEPA